MFSGRLPHLVLVAFVVVCLAPASCLPASPGGQRHSLDASGGTVGGDVDRDAGCDVAGDVGSMDSSGDGREVGPRRRTVTIATLNLHRFFDTKCDTSHCGPNAYEAQPSRAEFDARLAEIATALETLDADVVLLQEIEKKSQLEALQARLGSRYSVAVERETPRRDLLDVAVLAEGTLVDSRDYSGRTLSRPDGSPTYFAREFLRVDLDVGGQRLIVFTSHFKSKYSDDPGRRLAEAREARSIIDEVAAAHEGALVVLGGDLNDTPGSPPLEALTGQPGVERVAEGRALADIFTYYVYDEDRREAIDHLLVADTHGGGYIADTAHSVHDHQPAGYGGSDHGALVADFELR